MSLDERHRVALNEVILCCDGISVRNDCQCGAGDRTGESCPVWLVFIGLAPLDLTTLVE